MPAASALCSRAGTFLASAQAGDVLGDDLGYRLTGQGDNDRRGHLPTTVMVGRGLAGVADEGGTLTFATTSAPTPGRASAMLVASNLPDGQQVTRSLLAPAGGLRAERVAPGGGDARTLVASAAPRSSRTPR